MYGTIVSNFILVIYLVKVPTVYGYCGMCFSVTYALPLTRLGCTRTDFWQGCLSKDGKDDNGGVKGVNGLCIPSQGHGLRPYVNFCRNVMAAVVTFFIIYFHRLLSRIGSVRLHADY